MKSLAELKKLRDKAQKDLQARKTSNKPKVIVGMGTCGIAAGAREILKAIMEEVNKRELDVIITQTGCIGMCEKEPLVDVQLPGKERITYGNLTKDDVSKIVVEHIVNGNIVEDLAVAKLED
ncbi:(2Fe-2S) ferredoxin domain-containing protein [Orenia marismortui]|uniref:NADP-reducing hydrogenase subunit HndB n=1 Tax=Orenia marismortui TaxID=46469 RepID=A0A4R8HFK5_9FIRM|nr:(2Fe-2S) ferredoxin domain-containing protein [Orenia marismortui]TDX58885.1 NADP-reducing hydrogenase subunit HndB [Orenia marismortui]